MQLASFVESKVVSIALMGPSQIKDHLIQEGASGWELCGLGSSLAFLQREVGGDVVSPDYLAESITLSLPHQIAGMLKTRGAEGWSLGGIGASFAFLKRDRNRPAASLDYEMESITVKGIAGIEKAVETRAAAGWTLCGIGPNFAFFERPLESAAAAGPPACDRQTVEVKVHSISLKTPGQIADLLSREGEEGWWLCAVGRSFAFLRRRGV